jgi:hypothetical protein
MAELSLEQARPVASACADDAAAIGGVPSEASHHAFAQHAGIGTIAIDADPTPPLHTDAGADR